MTDLVEQLRRHARHRPDAPALLSRQTGGRVDVTTYAALAEEVNAFAASFAELSDEPAIIPLLLPKSRTCVAAMFGALAAGKAFACLNRKLRGPQIEQILQASRAQVALIDAAALTVLASDVSIAPALARVQWRLVIDQPLATLHSKAIDRLRAAGVNINKWVPAAASPIAPTRPTNASGCCLFTSGSTGIPKGVLISRDDLAGRAAAEVDLFHLTSSDVLLSVLPFSFDVGLNQLLSTITAGACVVLMDSWLPSDVLRAAADHRITGISAVPSVWLDMLNANAAFDTRAAHASLRYLTISGGDLPADMLCRIPALAAAAGIYKTYGQSETFRSTALLPEDFADHSQTVGRPFASAKVYVVRDDLTAAAPGEEGEILHVGLGTMLGYLGDTQPDCLRPNPFFGASDPNPIAVFTGDVGFLDAAGYLHLRGRRDAMIKINGNRLYPQEVVAQLVHLPGVREAEVFGVKAADGQTRLIAFAVVEGSTRPDDLRRLSATRLPSYMVPQLFVPLPHMPRTPSGKTDRPALARTAAELVSS